MPIDLSGQPLDELKQWLAVTTVQDDALLLRLLETAWQLCFQFTGVEASDWPSMDAGLRHGVIRHAAHQYRERDAGPSDHLPAAIAALWRPYRRMRL
ncbi:head-tail connector protein [Erythrobacter sp. SD-21]|uniref:head-tail connector protein n=1 Tax=Erythrobacter sp. SD-21 TaxID=161528 RepID=UPI000153F77B|nr:head-tail connector protein [Erythrobacter sp. SD-21]EDL49057.1 hypothetical protein ED21_20294 [Erythrobacter sp. SD-21]